MAERGQRLLKKQNWNNEDWTASKTVRRGRCGVAITRRRCRRHGNPRQGKTHRPGEDRSCRTGRHCPFSGCPGEDRAAIQGGSQIEGEWHRSEEHTSELQ